MKKYKWYARVMAGLIMLVLFSPLPSMVYAQRVTINVLSVEGLAVPFLEWKAAWEQKTGNKVNVIEAPYAALYSKVMTDLITGTGRYDLMHLPGGWAGDLMGGGWLVPLDEELMPKYGFPNWDEVVPSVKTISQWRGHIYNIPIDGDCHTTYYRKDALGNPAYQARFEQKYGYRYDVPPKTWEEVLDVAEFFTGWDWDNDGKTNYGVAFIGLRGNQAPWFVIDLAASYVVNPGKVDKYHGVAFFDPETMEPLVNTPGWIEAMTLYKKLAKHAPPGVASYGFNEMRMAFVSGIAAMTFDWGDTAIMAQMPEQYGSVIKGKLGTGTLPGAMRVWDRQSGRWLKQFNHVNFLAFGGWILTIPKTSKYIDEAYKFGCFLSDPKQSIYDVCGLHGFTGANPYRESHRQQIDMWVKGGWDEADVKEYLEATWEAYTDPFALQDLRIPGTKMYREDYLDLARAKVLSEEMSPEEACKELYDNWNRITDTYDRATQLLLYRLGLGLPAEVKK